MVSLVEVVLKLRAHCKNIHLPAYCADSVHLVGMDHGDTHGIETRSHLGGGGYHPLGVGLYILTSLAHRDNNPEKNISKN